MRDARRQVGAADLQAAASQLDRMRRSEALLRAMPGAEPRAAALKALAEQLEALLRPQLLAALQKERVLPTTLRGFVDMCVLLLLLLLLLLPPTPTAPPTSPPPPPGTASSAAWTSSRPNTQRRARRLCTGTGA